jgi:AraC-like DNA-binding protein
MANKKSIGFTGERIIEVPNDIIKECRKMPLINTLFITKMGLYPKARHHYFNRPKGISEAILIYCTDGNGWIKLPTIKIQLKAGEVFIIAPGIPHSYGSGEDSPWTIYWFHLSGTNCDQTAKALMANAPAAGCAVNVGVSDGQLSIFYHIEDAFLKGYSISNLMYANLSVPYFLASFILPHQFDKTNIKSEQNTPIEKAIQFMRDNFSEPVRLADIAAAANLSVSFFSRTFKNETGYSPAAYFNYLKIQRACQLLHLSKLRVNEVALQVGIADQFYFSRLFKKQIGTSPQKYRKNETS